MDWSPQQSAALIACSHWLRDPSQQVFYLAGFAGTGKTTLAKYLVAMEVPGSWQFAAYTGKASYVLRQKGCEGATTIHRLVYRPAGESKHHEIELIEYKIRVLRGKELLAAEDKKQLDLLLSLLKDLKKENQPRFALWANSPLADAHIVGVVIDEVSMVDAQVGKDLESFGKKILVLGDPAQLPPVGAGGYYTKREPDVMLTEVHRHAAHSGILQLATHIREGNPARTFDFGTFSDLAPVMRSDVDRNADLRKLLGQTVVRADQVLCGLNKTRHEMNVRHRELINQKSPGPLPKDRLVCLRNDHPMGLFNGSQWVVKESNCDFDGMTANMVIQSEDNVEDVKEVETWLHHMMGQGPELNTVGVHARRDLCEFDWSYALTVHKSQGSQWNSVVLFDQSRAFRGDAAKWLYTGVTRAAKHLTIVI